MSTSSNNAQPKGRFFVLKHLAMFAGIAFLILAVDLVLYIGIALFESQSSYHSNNSSELQQSEAPIPIPDVAYSLQQDESGAWTFTDQGLLDAMDARSCWTVLIDESGAVVWSYNTPEDLPATFTRNDIAVMAHERSYGTSTTFIWTKDANLVVMGYPRTEYLAFGFTLSAQAFSRIPLYFMLIFTIDLLLIFLLYVFSQRTLLKSTNSMLDALDNLGEGKPARVSFSGSLRVVGNRINRVSDTLIHKETARKNWIAGISHDVRTPLAIAMGHAERIEHDNALPEATRESAATISRQGIRIRDLIEDLNIATQLEYDMQPIKSDSIVMARIMRSVVADYLNQNLLGDADIELDIDQRAAQLSFDGDERLLKRALRNAIDNALKHNAYRCHITLSLEAAPSGITLSISDDGRGMNEDQLTKLAVMLEQDYLGAGSISSRSAHNITFSSAQIYLTEQHNDGSPQPPQISTSKTYSMGAPIISSQKPPVGTTESPSSSKRPPKPPYYESVQAIIDANTSASEKPVASAASRGPIAPPELEAQATPSTPRGGSIGQHGLGLPLIARIVLVHKGSFTLASHEGEGFSIIMTFPHAYLRS